MSRAGTDRSTARAVVGVVGEALLTAGVVLGLFVVYTLFWTGVSTSAAQDELAAELDGRGLDEDGGESGSAPEVEAVPEAEPGEAYARLRIPRLGEDWEWVVVQGVGTEDLRAGPGHYPGSADPGEVGNLAIAGHRATYGEPFAHLDRLQVGDDILVEYRGAVLRYVVTDSFLTTPDDASVVAPVPGEPDAVPSQAAVTLTTCHPRFSGAERLIVHGVLDGSEG